MSRGRRSLVPPVRRKVKHPRRLQGPLLRRPVRARVRSHHKRPRARGARPGAWRRESHFSVVQGTRYPHKVESPGLTEQTFVWAASGQTPARTRDRFLPQRAGTSGNAAMKRARTRLRSRLHPEVGARPRPGPSTDRGHASPSPYRSGAAGKRAENESEGDSRFRWGWITQSGCGNLAVSGEIRWRQQLHQRGRVHAQ